MLPKASFSGFLWLAPATAPHSWCVRTSSQAADTTCLVQVPKPPKKDFYKLMNKDKIILRFGCRFVETATHKLSPADR